MDPPHDPLFRDALEELVGLWTAPRGPATNVDTLVSAANTLLGRPKAPGAPDAVNALGDLVRPRPGDLLSGLTPPVLPTAPARDIEAGLAPTAPIPPATAGPAWTAADLSNVAADLDVPFADPELIAHILALSPNAAVIVELRKAAYRLDKTTTRALLALLGALATLVRELSDGPLKTWLNTLDAASLVADIAERHAPGDEPQKRRRIDV
ncbi:MAG: hypothetical protein AAF318_01350 [Pseudomonadota bacterium]